ncbi:MAG: hypothetical protein IPH30_01090 [Betaproteobacteria bacterium]|nr:hypothetical protein [Betaproteobacteria bacterium]
MTRLPKRISLLWLAASLFLALPAAAAEKIQGPLMGVEWLLANRANAEVLVLDASPPPLHAKEHIPGAVSASIMSFGAREAPAAEMERRFRSWGIGAGRKVVLYDQGDPMWATRLYFDLQRHGFPLENLFVLDGGLAKWKEVGGAVTKEPTPAPAPGDFRVSAPKEELRVRLPEFLAASGDTRGNALVEALDASWHFGETAFFDRGGHIPNGILVPSADFYNADKTFKSAAEMQRMLDYLGVKRGQQVLTYCGGGVAASVPWFAMKHLLGYPKVRLFVESEMEWLRDDRGLPFWTYGAPYLMRETAWLKTWGGRMMRMYGVSDVSIVDVRPADAFAFGHLPFALNVPADEFRRHLASPAKLAEMLAKAGVRASDEAVVVSGAGLDKDSALAFLLLERLGQQRVSVFMDSQEKSVQAGLALADPKKPTPPSPGFRLVFREPAGRRADRLTRRYPRRVSQGLRCLREAGAHPRARGQGRPRALHRAPQRRRHAEGGEGHLEDAREGGRASLRGTGELLRRPGRGGGQLLRAQADGIPRREGVGDVARRARFMRRTAGTPPSRHRRGIRRRHPKSGR